MIPVRVVPSRKKDKKFSEQREADGLIRSYKDCGSSLLRDAGSLAASNKNSRSAN